MVNFKTDKSGKVTVYQPLSRGKIKKVGTIRHTSRGTVFVPNRNCQCKGVDLVRIANQMNMIDEVVGDACAL